MNSYNSLVAQTIWYGTLYNTLCSHLLFGRGRQVWTVSSPLMQISLSVNARVLHDHGFETQVKVRVRVLTIGFRLFVIRPVTDNPTWTLKEKDKGIASFPDMGSLRATLFCFEVSCMYQAAYLCKVSLYTPSSMWCCTCTVSTNAKSGEEDLLMF